MGYYSQVTLTMYEKDLTELLRCAKNDPSYAYDILKRAKIIQSSSDENVFTLHWDDIKWYHNNDGIQFINSFLRNDVQYAFKRIGEENGDVEAYQNDDDWYLSEHTSIMQYIEIDGCEKDANFIESLISDTPPQQFNDDEIEEVSEDTFLNVIGA